MPTSHAIPFVAGWDLWRWVLVRATGFPARMVLRLASAEISALADELANLERDTEPALRQAMSALDRLRDTSPADADTARRVARALRRRELPSAADLQALEIPAVHETVRLYQAARDLEARYDIHEQRLARVFHEYANDVRFREALLWQNPAALRTGVDRLLAHPDATDRAARVRQQLVASYIQRYCLKNDTIGFFGPFGWGELADIPGVVAEPGEQLLARREVFLEHWAVQAVANRLGMRRELRPYVVPRLTPTVAVAGTSIVLATGRTTTIPLAVARLLTACDGATPAREVARMLVGSGDAADEQEVYDMLDELAERKLVTCTFEPSAVVHPERALRKLLGQIDDAAVRSAALAELDRLEEARARVATAAGNAGDLERALAELSTVFEDLAGTAATRNAGETYAARTPVFEDCTRAFTLQIGQVVRARLAPVLALVFEAARWFTFEIARGYREQLRARYDALAAASPTAISYLRFWQEVSALIPERGPGPIGEEVATRLANHWTEILAVDTRQRRVELRAADIAQAVRERFAAPGPGWPGARHISPDVLIAASGHEAIERGDFLAVLGEVHPGNTLLSRQLAVLGPVPGEDEIARACEVDVGEQVTPVEPMDRVTRADAVTRPRRGFDVEVGAGRSWRPREQVLRVADLVVEPHGESLVVRDSRSGRRFDIIAFLEAYLAVMMTPHFKVGPQAAHVPRITIDGVVLCREQWRLAGSEFPAFRTEARGLALVAHARAWARELGLPRWVFVKVPQEPKPIYVDFESPIYIEMLAKQLRKATSATISEMLPDPEQLWIIDDAGASYTGELRMVAIDPLRYTAPTP